MLGDIKNWIERPWAPLVTFVAVYLVGYYTWTVGMTESDIAVFWPINAVLLVVMLNTPVGHWWRHVLATIAAEEVAGAVTVPFPHSLLFPTISVMGVVLAMVIYRYRQGDHCVEMSVQNIVVVSAIGSLISSPLSAVFGATVANWLFGGIDMLLFWRNWWLGDVVTYLVAAPAMIMAVRPRQMDRAAYGSNAGRLALFALSGLIIALAAVIFAPGDGLGARSVGPSLLMLLTVLLAIRASGRLTSLTVLAVTLFVVPLSIEGHGPFPVSDNSMLGVIAVQEFLVAMSLVAISLNFSVAQVRAAYERVKREAQDREQAQADLERVLAEVSKANQTKSDFLACMSHDLRTPLNAVLGFGQMIQLDPETRLSDKQREYVGYVLDSGERLHGLIEDLLDLTSIEAQRVDLVQEVFDLEAFLEGLKQEAEPRATSRQIAISLSVDAAPNATFTADKKRLYQVVSNVLGNAVKYNRDGGRVSISARLSLDQAEIKIEDTGIGIAENMQSKIFDLFQRGDSSVLKAHDGIGIGLGVSRRLIELMGGEIKLTSRLNLGTQVTLILPQPSPSDEDSTGDGENDKVSGVPEAA